MLFDQTYFNLLIAALLSLSGIAGAVTGIAKLCLGYSWSDRSSRIFFKHSEK
jgi:hypothetical protein